MAGAGITSGKRRNRVAWISAVLAGVALAAAGCSSASSSSTGSTAAAAGTGSASTSCPNGCELTVVTPNLDPSSAITIYLADDLGYFTKYGVNVNRINGVAAGSVPLLTSGKADLIDEGSTAAFPVAAQGKPISAIYNDIGGGALGGLAVASNSKYKNVNSLSGQRVGTVGTDGSQYGFANLFSGDVKKATGTGFTIVSFADNTTLINALESGQIAAASGSKAIFSSELASGKLSMVADPAVTSQRVALLGSAYTADTTISGIKSNLEAKHEAVVRFLEALVEANVYLHSHTLAQVATVLQKDSLFRTLPAGSILADITAQQPFYTPDRGYISKSLWDTSLGLFTRWDISTIGDVENSPTYSYSNFVDMSYLNEAAQRVGVAVP
jgi:NitT/TauT family transport system substrate-binding protein